jgi:CheY-like chemotaxis protein
VILDTYEIITESFDKIIDIQVNVPQSLPIMGDISGLSQVFMNLCANARDAMPEGGNLHIDCRKEGNRALVSISDTGHGMDSETVEKCFDPFFTTKSVNRGTGLGLSTAYGIVKEHGGEILAQSESGKGATFTLSFPLDYSSGQGQQTSSTGISGERGQKVLIVDDNLEICKTLKELLEAYGYQAAYVTGGKAAIAEYETWQPDVVLLDRNMPEMDGMTCAKKIMDRDPEAKIIIISGYDEIGPSGIDDQGRMLIKGYLTKPIDMNEVNNLLVGLLQ